MAAQTVGGRLRVLMIRVVVLIHHVLESRWRSSMRYAVGVLDPLFLVHCLFHLARKIALDFTEAVQARNRSFSLCSGSTSRCDLDIGISSRICF